MPPPVPFNRPHVTETNFGLSRRRSRIFSFPRTGEFTGCARAWLEERLGAARVFLTHSCTAALEMAALLAGIGPGDEVIMPSFTFVSTANAVVLRGGVPVFVDIRPDTLNLDETLIEAAITPRTRAILSRPLRRRCRGFGCHRCHRRTPPSAPHRGCRTGLFASWKGRPLGTFGALGAVSFMRPRT